MNENIAVIGLGYVGLPLVLAFSEHHQVVGYDVSSERVEKLKSGFDSNKDIQLDRHGSEHIFFTDQEGLLDSCSVFIVTVPTPIDRHRQPDLTCLQQASELVGRHLKREHIVVYESTVYPGCTEEQCLPILEKISGLRADKDFYLGYSPERINPGDKIHRLDNTIKIVSGYNEEALKRIVSLYEVIVPAGLHQTSSIKVAEAAKILENTQRDVNIALMNELSIILGRMGVNTYDVIEAAATKWNFMPFTPGLVGGHCIGVDPYYLDFKAKELNYHTQIISAGRFVNDSMGRYFGKKIVKRLIALGKSVLGSRALILGATFKENVRDIRNSKVVDIVYELQDYRMEVDIVDPYADTVQFEQMYGLTLKEAPEGLYDAVILAVAHHDFLGLDEDFFESLVRKPAVIGDVKGILKGKIHNLDYWSL